MSLLGIDVGTTGCKVAAFSTEGESLGFAYEEYEIESPQPGWAELDTPAVWDKIKQSIKNVVAKTAGDPVEALSVSSLGEAVAPVTLDRRILGPSLLNFDVRGQEYLEQLGQALDDDGLYRLTGNTLGAAFSLPKLMWIRDHQPEIYSQTDKFLPWVGFVCFMLGAEPKTDYALANRVLGFDLERGAWSPEVLDAAGIEQDKLPEPVPSGTIIGQVSQSVADELGLPEGAQIVAGAHDQCMGALGCGAVDEGTAMYGMGTYICIVPVFGQRPEPERMMGQGLNTEHHAAPDRYVSLIYNQGGVLFKWYRDTFAHSEAAQAQTAGEDIYERLLSEMPQRPSGLIVLPHFMPTGPPDFIADSRGIIAGLHLNTERGEILKGILEGVTFYFREIVERLPEVGIDIRDYRATGGGSKSVPWLQLSADILGKPFTRLKWSETGVLGAALLAGSACGIYSDCREAVEQLVQVECMIEPDPREHERYQNQFEHYKKTWPLMKDYLVELANIQGEAQS